MIRQLVFRSSCHKNSIVISKKAMLSLALFLFVGFGFLQLAMANNNINEGSTVSSSSYDGLTESEDDEHSIHILFCASWGSKRNFVQVREFLEYNFPELRGKVTGDNYPAPPIIELVLKVMSVIQLIGIVLAMLGSNAFRIIGMNTPPSFYTNVIEKNAMPIAIFIYLILPQMLSKYLVTGAFEIILDDSITIFSKLSTGRLPQMADLIDPLTKAGLVHIRT
jgi:selT/selW/selH-like putative selenoprotein